MTPETRSQPHEGHGDGGGWATAVAFVVGLFLLVVVAMTDLFMLIGFAAAPESGNCAGGACSNSHDVRAGLMFVLCALSLVLGLVGLLAARRRRPWALGAAVLLQAAGVAALWVRI
jgi:hypothetical protein